MADIRCPMCSRLNPDDLEVCQYCQARLKPLIVNSSPQPESAHSNGRAVRTPEEEIPEWLRTLRDKKNEDLQAAGNPPLGEPSLSAAEIAPDWELPDPLAGDEASQPQEDADAADWLNRIRLHNQGEPGGNAPSLVEPEIPWNADALSSSDTPEQPLWTEETATEDSAAGPADSSADEPDWLARLRTGPLDPAHLLNSRPQEPSWSASTGNTVSDWETQPEEPAETSAGGSPATASDSSELPESTEAIPDWLQQLISEPVTPPVEDVRPEIPTAQEPWRDSEQAAPAGELDSATEAEEPAELTQPETLWPLSASSGAASAIPGRSAASGAAFSASLPAWEEALADPHADLPQAVEDEPAPTEPISPAPSEAAEVDFSATQPAVAWQDGVLPDWLASIQSDVDANITPAAPGEEESSATASAEPAPDAQLPDWLIGLGMVGEDRDEAPERPFIESEEPGEALSPAELPGWVQAMRPLESITPENSGTATEVERPAEKTGPLAGLPGVLPARPLGATVQKPTAYALGLKVSEAQVGYAQILEQVVANETSARARPQPKAASTPQVLLHSIIAVILLVSIAFPLFSGLSMLPIPNLYPQEVLNVRSAIEEDLPENGAVLLVADYEPALAGELEASAAGVIDHLMTRSARLSVLSTQPTGAALAENLFKKIWQQPEAYHAAYQSGEKLAYLGYLAGGPGGMLSFAQQPQLSVPAMLPDGSTAWDQPALEGVSALTDFGLVIVMTDSADTGRAWVEQVKPYLGETPLLFVTSAQAAPVLYPYLDSQQIYGLVSGLAGGAAYEQIMQRSGLGSAYWNAFQTSLMVAIAVILIGGVVNAIIAVIHPSNPEDEA